MKESHLVKNFLLARAFGHLQLSIFRLRVMS